MDLRIYLKNISLGTKLYSLISGEVTFKEIRGVEIVVLDHNNHEQLYHFTGKLLNTGLDGECLLFPSKELRDWDLFIKFKKGDIIVDCVGIIAIFDHLRDGAAIVYNAIRRTNGDIIVKTDTGIGYANNARLATQEEKDLFFNSLHRAGHFWNGEEVVPLFKKGDIVVSVGGCVAIVDHVGKFGNSNDVVHYQCCLDYHGSLIIKVDVGVGHAGDCKYASIHDQDRILRKLNEQGFVLEGDTVVKKRFDPQTLEPFQKVLVRSSIASNWRCTFFSHMVDDTAVCSGDNWPYCIPYKLNEHLRGTSDDCKDFYKWWKNS